MLDNLTESDKIDLIKDSISYILNFYQQNELEIKTNSSTYHSFKFYGNLISSDSPTLRYSYYKFSETKCNLFFDSTQIDISYIPIDIQSLLFVRNNMYSVLEKFK